MKTTTFLTFVGNQCGKAEEAMNFYTTVFPNSEIKSIVKYNVGEPGGAPALVKHGVFTLDGTPYMISENNYNHAWSITPGVSLFVECSTVKINMAFPGSLICLPKREVPCIFTRH